MGFVKLLVIACLATLAVSQDGTTLPPTTPDVTTAAPTTAKPTTAGPITSTDHSTQPPTTTTTPAPTTTSTEHPTSSTQPPTTPAPTPKPTPKQYRGNYTLKDDKGDLCLVMLTKLSVVQNKTVAFTNGTVNLEASKCGDSTIQLWIDFAEQDGSVQITFTSVNASYYISEMAVQTPDFKAEKQGLRAFEVPHNKYYKCWQASEIDLKENGVRVIFAETEFEAFRKSPEAKFVGVGQECSSDYHSDVVIIAIGCALALLVVIILVAYLIARRKNRQRGYQSV